MLKSFPGHKIPWDMKGIFIFSVHEGLSFCLMMLMVNLWVYQFHGFYVFWRILFFLEFDEMVFWLIPPRIKRGEHVKHPFSAQQKKTRQGS